MFCKNKNNEVATTKSKQKKTYSLEVRLRFKDGSVDGVLYREVTIRQLNKKKALLAAKIATAVTCGKYCQLTEHCGFKGEEVIFYGLYFSQNKDHLMNLLP